ncbi:MAG TPA: Sec-independent protein translocase subunit TatA [Aldersonia sp.]
MGAMSPWHWAIVLIVLVLLFGSKRLPDAARGLGRSLRIFKSEVKEMQSDSGAAQAQQTATQPQQTATQPQPLPPAQPAPAQPVPAPPQQQHVDPK